MPFAPKDDDLASVEKGWDEIDVEVPLDTVRPPSPDDDEPREPLLDITTLSRAANTAASLGRAPTPQPTKKMKPFELADALARLSKKDGDG